MFCRYSLNFAEKIQTFNTYGQQTHKSLTLHLCGAGQKYVQNASNSRVNVSKATSQQAFKIYINNTAKVDPPQKKKKNRMCGKLTLHKQAQDQQENTIQPVRLSVMLVQPFILASRLNFHVLLPRVLQHRKTIHGRACLRRRTGRAEGRSGRRTRSRELPAYCLLLTLFL